MNYYHEITIGFNWWYIVAPMTLLLAYLFGFTKYKFDEETFTVMKRGGGDFLLKFVVVVLDTALHILLLVESGAGMLQLVANCIPDSDIAWAPVVVGAEFLLLYIIFYSALFSIGKVGESRRRRQVFRLRNKRIREERVEAKDPKEGAIVINL